MNNLFRIISGAAILSCSIAAAESSSALGEPASGPSRRPHPIYGVLTASQKVLLGADEDGNGVRDDVDQFIAQKFSPSPLARKAVTAYAKAVTGSILFSGQLITEEESSRRLAVFFCASDELERVGASNAKNWNEVIVARTANTEARVHAYDAWDHAQNVSTSLDLETDACKQAGL
jgi:hypothetical protein